MTFPAQKQTLHDEMVAFLREHKEGISSAELASRFLKLKNAPLKIADGAIKAILAGDRRVNADENGLWRAVHGLVGTALEDQGEPLQSLPWSAVYCLTDPAGRRPLYFSAWVLFPAPACTHAAWLVDPKLLPYEEGELLQSSADVTYGADLVDRAVAAFACDSAGRVPVFLSSNHRELLASLCAENGENIGDDSVLLRELLKAADFAVLRSLDLASAEKIVLGTEGRGETVYKQAERFASLLFELFELLKRKGIETRAALDVCRPQESAALFTGKNFSYADILALPATPGVYAFKDVAGKHLYIGKANNLKRRLQSYWKESDESPDKLNRIRENAHDFVTHRCGSELESLIYESRLIRKYVPPLNKKVDIAERKGTFRPIDDCIVLLPHAEEGKGMSVWFRKDQKIHLKPFDATFPADAVFTGELEEFFFSPVLKPGPMDFPEQEISVRWIKRHADTLAILPVGRLANAGEIHAALKSLWADCSESFKTFRSIPFE